jgi:DNA polymerase III subunit gamma/tau
MDLALKYRPRTFQDVVGQKAPSAILAAMIQKNNLAQALLFTGPSGVGKTSMARIVAAALNPESAEDVHNGTHPFVLEIDAASNGSVEAIRKLRSDLEFAVPSHRVVILDEAHAMSDEAFTTLLNMLEKKKTGLTFILITTESQQIPTTVRHRCDTYHFKKASIEDVLSRMQYVVAKENINVSTELLDLLAQRSEASFREALMMLDQSWTAGITTVEEYNELHGEIDFGPGLIACALSGSAAALVKLEGVLRYTHPTEVISRTVETLRDIIVLKGGGNLNCSGDMLESRTRLSKKLDLTECVKAISIIWDLQTKLSNTDPVRGLEMAFAMLGEILKREEVKSIIPPKPEQTLTLEDMQRLTGG